MKTRTLVLILILVLAVLIIIGGCATPLRLKLAVSRDDLFMVKRLVKNEVDVNAKYYGGYTPLILATVRGQEDIVKLLIEGGANLNAQTYNNFVIDHEGRYSGIRNTT